jgi:signal peptidase I
MASSIASLRKRALDLIRMGDKVFHYRKDLLETGEIDALKQSTLDLEDLYRDRTVSAEAMEGAILKQHEVLCKTGGAFYPNRFMSENIETVLVVAIVIIAFRIFFFQPFVIPTNSMYPSYAGMQPQWIAAEESPPNPIERGFIKLISGGTYYGVKAQDEGLLMIPIDPRSGRILFKRVAGKKWGFMPTHLNEYTLYVGKTPHVLRTPADFGADELLMKRMGEGERSIVKSGNHYLVHSGIQVRKGENVIHFILKMGDALFVNRMWYHFVRPKSGDAIVFRTENFMHRAGFPSTVGEDKFYIKRLAGAPGDVLEVRDFQLLQNGFPASGASAFESNATQEGEFPGYRNEGLLTQGHSYRVPEGHYFAMGDNSSNSKDSRYFGPVPKKDMIGAAAFIYYPFTRRWGVAR